MFTEEDPEKEMTIEEETEQLEEAIKQTYFKLKDIISEGEENFKSSKNYVAQLEVNKRLLKTNRNLKKCSSRLLELYYMQTIPLPNSQKLEGDVDEFDEQ